MEEKIVEILRSRFNLYHSECILDMIFNDEMDIYSFRSEVSKIIEAEKNDIDEYDNPEIVRKLKNKVVSL